MRHGWTYWIGSLLLASSSSWASADLPTPEIPSTSILLAKTAITISYNPEHKQADWVFYPLGQRQLRDCYDRQNNFRADPTLPSGVASQLSDYRGSGFDRGHLSPAGDNKSSQAAMSDSFLLSNISPQPPRFNQGIWARLENLVRAWALKAEGIWVATGPILKSGLSSIGANHVSVPDAFYKVIITQREGHREGIGIEMPTDASGDLSAYATTIDQIEKDTGIDFFQGIPNERKVETGLDLNEWDFRARFQPLPCDSRKSTEMDLMAFFITKESISKATFHGAFWPATSSSSLRKSSL